MQTNTRFGLYFRLGFCFRICGKYLWAVVPVNPYMAIDRSSAISAGAEELAMWTAMR